jgi:hypothetical protein
MDSAVILGTHLPPAIGQTSEFLDMLAAAPDADPFVGPDQHALEQNARQLRAGHYSELTSPPPSSRAPIPAAWRPPLATGRPAARCRLGFSAPTTAA